MSQPYLQAGQVARQNLDSAYRACPHWSGENPDPNGYRDCCYSLRREQQNVLEMAQQAAATVQQLGHLWEAR